MGFIASQVAAAAEGTAVDLSTLSRPTRPGTPKQCHVHSRRRRRRAGRDWLVLIALQVAAAAEVPRSISARVAATRPGAPNGVTFTLVEGAGGLVVVGGSSSHRRWLPRPRVPRSIFARCRDPTRRPQTESRSLSSKAPAGWRVPITATADMGTLARELGLPALIVRELALEPSATRS
jgi:hypothetical protein